MTVHDVIAVEPVRVRPWAVLVLVAAALALYALTMENGWVLRAHAAQLHELFHDARHFIGVPCH